VDASCTPWRTVEVLGGRSGRGRSPMSIEAGGMARATRAKTSTTSVDALDGRKLERWTREFFFGRGEAGALEAASAG